MQYFAELGIDNIVWRVITVDDKYCKDENGNIVESIGAQWCRDNLRGVWKMTDINGVFRKNFAGTGMKYDSQRDAFIPIKEYDDWVFNEETCKWVPPVPKPTDSDKYEWDNITKMWSIKE